MMKISTTVTLASLLSCALASAEEVKIVPHFDKPGVKISPRLYGVFFEEINHAGDGGLYAELLQNRNLKETEGGSFKNWTVTTSLSSLGQPAKNSSGGIILGSGESAVNEGYWGISVGTGQVFRVSVEGTVTSGKLIASLVDGTGKVLASSEVKAGKVATLKSATYCSNARFALTAVDGTSTITFASLFPKETYKNRPNGLRLDLAEHVAALKPAFVRFPGGCFVEGGNLLRDAFRWKESLGPVSSRPGHINGTWGYRSTGGLGFHEYLQWCEDMKSEPLFVVNCGLSHKEMVPLNELQPWIQDALDSVEYANGPVTSKWGALRAKNGHPKPFNLKFIEIGNENGLWEGNGGNLAEYTERYLPFYNALKKAYPDLIYIANTRGKFPMELVDDHYYNSPDWFWANIGLYDKAPRNGPKVYVGEYAVTSDCGQGNLKAALAEAAFLTGLERNSDVVEMASYAPLFVNVNNRAWNPNAIVFDSGRSFGTPSYHVQQMYAQYRPDVNIPVEYPEILSETVKGGIGLGTWKTQAEYKDIEVVQDGKSVYKSDFTSGAGVWKPAQGDWKVVDGTFQQADLKENNRVLLDLPALKDASKYTLHVKARKLSGDEGFLIMVKAKDSDNFVWWNIGGWVNTRTCFERSVAGGHMTLQSHVPFKIESNRWYDIAVEVDGNQLKGYIDGKLVQAVEDRGAPVLAVGAGIRTSSNEVILKVINRSDKIQESSIDLSSYGREFSGGEVSVLASGSLEDENSLDRPTRIAPVSSKINVNSKNLKYKFAPYSLTIIKLKAK